MSPAAPCSLQACGDSGSCGAEVPRASSHPGPEPPLHPVAKPQQHPRPHEQPPRAWRPGPSTPAPARPHLGLVPCSPAAPDTDARTPAPLPGGDGGAGQPGWTGNQPGPPCCCPSPVTLSPRDSASPNQHSGAADPLY